MDYDVIVIGGGPAGYVAAIRAGQLGKKTLIVEKERLGGMCLNWGCIPTKALLESARKLEELRGAAEFGISGIDPDLISFNFRKAASRADRVVKKLTKGIEFLLKKNKVEIEIGEAELVSPGEVQVNNRLLSASHIILATGSRPVLPDIDGLSEKDLLPMKTLLRQEELPSRPVIIGDGPPAIEMALFFSMSGNEPLLLTLHERPAEMADPFISESIDQLLRKRKMQVRSIYGVRFDVANGTLHHGDWAFSFDGVINLADRRAVLPSVNGFSLETDDNGFVSVDERLMTSQENIYAVGDMNGLSVFAHAASAQGLYVVNHLSGVTDTFAPKSVPFNLYTWPEMAQVGLGEKQLKDKGMEYKTVEFQLSANGKAMAEGHRDGRIRMYFEPHYGEILGVVIVAPNATDMIAEAVSLIELEATVADMARMVHAHPTVSEVMMEAAYLAIDAPIHA